MILAWIIGIVFSVLPFFSPNQYVVEGFQTSCSFDFIDQSQFNRILIIVSNVFGFFIPIIVMIANYILIFAYLKRYHSFTDVNKSKGNKEEVSLNDFKIGNDEVKIMHKINFAMEWQLTKKTLFIVCGFCLAW